MLIYFFIILSLWEMNVWSLNFIFIIKILVLILKWMEKSKLMLFYLRLMGFFFWVMYL